MADCQPETEIREMRHCTYIQIYAIKYRVLESYFLHDLPAASDTADHSFSSSRNTFFTWFLGRLVTSLFIFHLPNLLTM